MSRYLVIANQTIGRNELMDEIRRRIASGPSSFYVVVPVMPVVMRLGDVIGGVDMISIHPSVNDDLVEREQGLRDQAEMTAQSRLSQLTSQIRAEGGEADGQVGGSDPVKAIDEAMAGGGFDQIIISTLPEGVSRWLRMDVPNRVKRKFKIPVTTVTAK